jgi:hypothetical protein
MTLVIENQAAFFATIMTLCVYQATSTLLLAVI